MGERRDRYEGLVGSTLLAATPDAADVAGSWALVERDVLSLVMEEDEHGVLTPVFTSTGALARWRAEGGCYVERDAAWLFGVAAADPAGRVVVDPGSPGSVVLDPWEVAALGEGRSPAEAGTRPVLVATPLEPLAAAIAAAVHDAVAAQPAARSARMFLVDQTGDGPQPVVLVDLEPGADGAGVAATMTAIVEGVAARTEDAGGLSFGVVTDTWRATYDAGGLAVFER